MEGGLHPVEGQPDCLEKVRPHLLEKALAISAKERLHPLEKALAISAKERPQLNRKKK